MKDFKKYIVAGLILFGGAQQSIYASSSDRTIRVQRHSGGGDLTSMAIRMALFTAAYYYFTGSSSGQSPFGKQTNILKVPDEDLFSHTIPDKVKQFVEHDKRAQEEEARETSLFRAFQDSVAAEKSNTILLDGRPGTGKTQTAKWIAQELNVPCIIYPTTKLEGDGYVGGNARLVTQLFEDAYKARNTSKKGIQAVICLDEIDRFGGDRAQASGGPGGGSWGKIERGATNLLLTMLENDKYKNILIIGTTNEQLDSGYWDSAFLDRFFIKCTMNAPTQETYQAIIKSIVTSRITAFFKKHVPYLPKMTLEGYAQRLYDNHYGESERQQLEQLAQAAAGHSIRKLQQATQMASMRPIQETESTHTFNDLFTKKSPLLDKIIERTKGKKCSLIVSFFTSFFLMFKTTRFFLIHHTAKDTIKETIIKMIRGSKMKALLLLISPMALYKTLTKLLPMLNKKYNTTQVNQSLLDTPNLLPLPPFETIKEHISEDGGR